MNEEIPQSERRPDYILNGDGSFMDEDQIVEDLKRNVARETLRAWSKTGIGVTDRSPFSRWVRNAYGLWLEDNPHTVVKWAVEREQPENTFAGCDASPSHPDNYSRRVITKFETWLKENAHALA